MSPRSISDGSVRRLPLLEADERVATAVRTLLDSGLPALPVVDAGERYVGIFGEREFLRALFPGYLDQLQGAGFLRRSLDETLEKRVGCAAERLAEHMNTEHVDVGLDHSDAQLAEIFLHHRVLIVPVLDDDHVAGIVTRTDFFRTIAERFLERQ
jgi:CBS domain-containing protein